MVTSQSKRDEDEKPLGDRGMMRWYAKLKDEGAEIQRACEMITDKVRVMKTAKAVEMQKRRVTERGDIEGLNEFIYGAHDKLRLKKRSEDPNIPA